MGKTIKPKTLTLLLIFSVLVSFGQESIEKRVSEIRNEFRLINNSNHLLIDTINLDLGGEGGEMFVFRDKEKNIKKISVTYYGESVKLIEEYYSKSNKLLFVFTQDYRYNRPFYWDEQAAKESVDDEVFDLGKSVIRENRFYFDKNENLIQWIDENNRVKDQKLRLREKGLEIKNEFNSLIEIANQK